MTKYIVKRILIAAATLFAILFLLFLLMQLLPGSPFNDEKLTADQIAVLEQKYGLDQPLLIRFFRYVGHMLTGDFGVSYSISKNTPITQLLRSRLPVSLRIGGESVLLGTLVGLLLGVIAAVRHNTIWDTLCTVISVLGVSIPSYVFALALSYTFGFKWQLFSMLYDTDAPFRSSLLPCIALSMFTVATIARFTRSELLEVLGSDYMRFAKSRGLSDFECLCRHGLRNTLIPVLTVLAPLVVSLMTGSLVVEKIFAIPGIGGLLVTAIQSNDYNVILALSFVYSALYIGVMLAVDLLYGLIDPRVRLSAEKTNEAGVNTESSAREAAMMETAVAETASGVCAAGDACEERECKPGAAVPISRLSEQAKAIGEADPHACENVKAFGNSYPYIRELEDSEREPIFFADDFEPAGGMEEQQTRGENTPQTLRRAAWRRFRKNKGAVAGLIIIAVLVVLALAGPEMNEYTYSQQSIDEQNFAPRIRWLERFGMFDGSETITTTTGSIEVNGYEESGLTDTYYWFGSDTLGRDIWTRTWMGARVSLFVAVAAVLIDLVFGMGYGMLSGYFGGKTDMLLQRLLELVNGIPTLVIVTLLLIALKPGLGTICLALMITGWIGMARIARAQMLKAKEQEYVLAARTLGAGHGFLMFREILPNILGQLVTNTMFSIPNAIFTEAFLSFVGLGVPAPMASLGSLISDAFKSFTTHPYQIIPPVTVLALLMLSFNLVADGLKDAMNPAAEADK